jgi:hypothetical protein
VSVGNGQRTGELLAGVGADWERGAYMVVRSWGKTVLLSRKSWSIHFEV